MNVCFNSNHTVLVVLSLLLISSVLADDDSIDSSRAQAIAHFEAVNPPELIQIVADARDWLQQHPDPTYRSLGLIHDTLPGFSSFIDQPNLKNNSNKVQHFLARVEQLLMEQPEAPALFFLMLACKDHELLSECDAIGLLDALDQKAPGNLAVWGTVAGLASWGTLVADHYADPIDAILRADTLNVYSGDASAAWREALYATKQANHLNYASLESSIPLINPDTLIPWLAGMFGLSIIHKTMIPFGIFFDICSAESNQHPGSEMVASCDRLTSMLRGHREVMIFLLIGLRVSADLAESREQLDLAEHYAQINHAWRDWMKCVNLQTEEFRSRGSEQFANHVLDLRIQYGEVGGKIQLAEEMNVSCGPVPSDL